MRRAMAEAEVGDDSYGEDPSVNALEAEAARITGKEAALFVASGTMANQVAVKVHTRPGDELIADATSHVYNFEAGGAAALSGVQCRPVQTEKGILSAEQVEAAVQPPTLPRARTGLISVENTHNRGGGSIYPLETLREIQRVADRKGIPVHMDGARIFNASVASDVPVSEYARCATTLSFCLSKGLGAPFGSLITGDKDRIREARRYRQVFGGGMRQAGIMAAAGLYALKRHVERLAEDHAKAKRLAEGLAALPGVGLPFGITPTNIVAFEIAGTGKKAPAVAAALKERGVLVSVLGEVRFRALTHLDVTEGDIDRALAEIRACLKS
ncbi:MAG: aminotransferase class I/II-fold pyridoxal phosphate-dependent enzyme [Candidatus Tectomicrobia bacterium]|nr:aminotransferase class I/II-fold pyridoxal phosphate-dependent enzyme [Candidatus Tectomicrobia bacterium]